MTPLVSIVTPSLNQGHFIEETIQSVLNQDYPNIEYLVLDGGSTDNTLEILRKYEGCLKWLSETDGGQSHAINKGFARASGDWMAWINSDDVLYPGALAAIARAADRDPGAGLIYGAGAKIDPSGRVIQKVPSIRA